MQRHRGRRDLKKRGQSLVEMALVLPILLLLVAAIADFGRAFNSYIVITNAAREGARFAARVDHTDTIDEYIRGAVIQEAANSGVDLGRGPHHDRAALGCTTGESPDNGHGAVYDDHHLHRPRRSG